MRQIGDQDIREIVRESLDFACKPSRSRFQQLSAMTYCVANFTLEMIFGQEWWRRSASPWAKGESARFLRLPKPHDIDASRNHERTVALAEGLINLQSVEGWAHLCNLLVTESLESTTAEVRAASLLLLSGHEFRIVAPRGTRGQDFDLELRLVGGRMLPVEIKSKMEATPPSSSGIVKALRKITDQCPQDAPCAGFVCLTERWAQSPGFMTTLCEATDSAFRNSDRLCAAVFMWERYEVVDEKFAGCDRRVQEFHNKKVFVPGFTSRPIVRASNQRLYDPRWRPLQARVLACLKEFGWPYDSPHRER